MTNNVRPKNGLYEPSSPLREYPLFVTLETYSMAYVNGDDDVPVIVNGNDAIDCAFLKYDPNGKHKQMVTFTGDVINGGVKLELDGQETGLIDFDTVTQASLTAEMETIVGADNVYVSLWPGRWLFEFEDAQTELISVLPTGLPVFRNKTLLFDYADARKTKKVFIPFPLLAGYDDDNSTVLNAVAAGSLGVAAKSEVQGYVALSLECREYNSAGNPDL